VVGASAAVGAALFVAALVGVIVWRATADIHRVGAKGSKQFLTIEALDLGTDLVSLWITERVGDLAFTNDPSGLVHDALFASVLVGALAYCCELVARWRRRAFFKAHLTQLRCFHFVVEDTFQTVLYAAVAASQANEAAPTSDAVVFAAAQAVLSVAVKIVDMVDYSHR
jgi:hypothetical protein